jgi:hypothetical protein
MLFNLVANRLGLVLFVSAVLQPYFVLSVGFLKCYPIGEIYYLELDIFEKEMPRHPLAHQSVYLSK